MHHHLELYFSDSAPSLIPRHLPSFYHVIFFTLHATKAAEDSGNETYFSKYLL